MMQCVNDQSLFSLANQFPVPHQKEKEVHRVQQTQQPRQEFLMALATGELDPVDVEERYSRVLKLIRKNQQEMELLKVESAVKVQAMTRGFLQRRRSLTIRISASSISTMTAMESVAVDELAMNITKSRYACQIQAIVRGYLQRLRYREAASAKVSLQALQITKTKYAIQMQAAVRGYLERQRHLKAQSGQALENSKTSCDSKIPTLVRKAIANANPNNCTSPTVTATVTTTVPPETLNDEKEIINRLQQLEGQVDLCKKQLQELQRSRDHSAVNSVDSNAVDENEYAAAAKKIQLFFKRGQQRKVAQLQAELDRIEQEKLSSLKIIQKQKKEKIQELERDQYDNPNDNPITRAKLVIYLRKENNKLKEEKEKLMKRCKKIEAAHNKLVDINSQSVCKAGKLEVEVKNLQARSSNLSNVVEEYREAIRQLQGKVQEYDEATHGAKRSSKVLKSFIRNSVRITQERCTSKRLKDKVVRLSFRGLEGQTV